VNNSDDSVKRPRLDYCSPPRVTSESAATAPSPCSATGPANTPSHSRTASTSRFRCFGF